MQTRSSDENSVCPSVRPSVQCHTRELWQNGRKICPDLYTIFLRRRMVGGGDPFYLKLWVNGPRWSKIADFQPIFARSASAVTPSEKSSTNANRKSTTRFPMSLRWSSYVAPKSPKRGLKNAKRPICVKKSDFAWRKSATKFFLCENCQRQNCKAFIGLTNRTKMIGGRRPLVPEILSQSDRVGTKFEQAAITPKRYEIACQLLLITNRK